MKYGNYTKVFLPESLNIPLTKREFFAAIALQGLLANSTWLKNVDAEGISIGEVAVWHADQLIKALNK